MIDDNFTDRPPNKQNRYYDSNFSSSGYQHKESWLLVDIDKL